MSRDPHDRTDMLAMLGQSLTRDLMTAASLFQGAVADHYGLNITDFICAGVIISRGPMTAGQLAEAVGITTGAITGVVDRLDKAGFVTRAPDPADRRRVVIEPVPAKAATLTEVYRSVGNTMSQLSERFDAQELAAITGFLDALVTTMNQEAQRLRGSQQLGADANVDVNASLDMGASAAWWTASTQTTSSPLGRETEGQVDFLSGINGATVVGAPLPGLLYRADATGGSRPNVRVRGGHVSVQLGWQSWLGAQSGSSLTLNSEIPWQISSRGNISQAALDFRQLHVKSFLASGSIDRAKVLLGQPHGVVRLESRGNVSRMAILHPPDVAVTLQVQGNAYKLRFGRQSYDAFTGHIKLQTPGAADMANRFEVVVRGSVSELGIEPM
ncbi:MAG TPA: MarR family transcriptional regulator [Ktedonobacterales bacterium]